MRCAYCKTKLHLENGAWLDEKEYAVCYDISTFGNDPTPHIPEQEALTLEDAKQLRVGQILYSRTERNSDGSARRWKVNGKPKTWKRNPERVYVPVKYGLYTYDTITEDYLSLVSLEPSPKELEFYYAQVAS